jgi:hypothetical protein
MKPIISMCAIAAMTCSVAAWAVPPEQYPIVPFQVTGDPITDCGDFLVLADYRGEVYQRDYFNNDGTLKRIFYSFNFSDQVFYNSNDPSYWLPGDRGHSQVWYHFQDGVPVSAAQNGPQIKVTIPGYGAVLLEGGRLVYDIALGEFVLVAGRHDLFNGITDAFCAALRP